MMKAGTPCACGATPVVTTSDQTTPCMVSVATKRRSQRRTAISAHVLRKRRVAIATPTARLSAAKPAQMATVFGGAQRSATIDMAAQRTVSPSAALCLRSA